MMDKVSQGMRELSMEESLIQRVEDTKEKIINPKEEKQLTSKDQVRSFELTSDKQFNAISDRIKCIEEKKVDQNELLESFSCLRDDIESLKKDCSVSTRFLHNYAVRKNMQNLEKLEKKLKELEATLLPKKKFGFKSKKKSDLSKPKPTKTRDEVDVSIDKGSQVLSANLNAKLFSLTSCGFSDKINENLKLCNDVIAKNDIDLRNLENCVVFLCGTPSTVHISNVTRCKILSGPVSTSVFIEHCSDSDIVVACQQLRVHSTKDTRFYIHVTSRAVVEDSRNIQFAPYNLEYEQLETHFEHSGLNKSLNNWSTIDDFNWLASDAHSPNWSLVNPEERVLNWLPFNR